MSAPPSIEAINGAANAVHLDVLGMLHDGDDTLILLGPRAPGFWSYATASAEFKDSAPDPLDRLSHRIIGTLAKDLDATAIFPSDGPPYPAFISWALASGQAWISPVGMLVHAEAGLFVSFRGALRIKGHIALPPAAANPCIQCAAPCRAACPVDALTRDHYDVDACKAHIRSADSAQCAGAGCAARRICPISQNYPRLPEQSAFHMRAFLGE